MPSTSVKIRLENDLQINGVKIPAGTHEVTPAQAEDWTRIDRAASQEVLDHHRSYEVNAQTLRKTLVSK